MYISIISYIFSFDPSAIVSRFVLLSELSNPEKLTLHSQYPRVVLNHVLSANIVFGDYLSNVSIFNVFLIYFILITKYLSTPLYEYLYPEEHRYSLLTGNEGQ